MLFGRADGEERAYRAARKGRLESRRGDALPRSEAGVAALQRGRGVRAAPGREAGRAREGARVADADAEPHCETLSVRVKVTLSVAVSEGVVVAEPGVGTRNDGDGDADAVGVGV